MDFQKVTPVMKSIPIEEQKEVWLKAWVAVAGVANTTSTSTATHWADVCLEEYIQRFESKCDIRS